MKSSDASTAGDLADFLLAAAKAQGVAVARVTDGRVLLFTEQRIKQLLEVCQKSGREMVTIFVKETPSDGLEN